MVAALRGAIRNKARNCAWGKFVLEINFQHGKPGVAKITDEVTHHFGEKSKG